MQGALQFLATGKLRGQSVNTAQLNGPAHLLRLFDLQNTRQFFLIDTGAEISVFPASQSHRLHNSNFTLRTANNSTINTYGYKQLTLYFSLQRPLTRHFILADVTQVIIGVDFLYSTNYLSISTRND